MLAENRFLRVEGVREGIYQWLLKEPRSATAICKEFHLRVTSTRSYIERMLDNGYLFRFMGSCPYSKKPVFLYKASPIKPYVAKTIDDYEEELAELHKKKHKISTEYGGKVIIDPKNPNKRTYLNLDRNGRDYSYQRKKHKTEVWKGSSMALMADL